uniref:Uncharacterized protein n=1 Tax=Tetraodon nigroviridis TaxID=99883 RepID=H3DN00_TETNG
PGPAPPGPPQQVVMSSPCCLLTEDQLLCDVCLEVFSEPVSLPCGHTFCRACVEQHWEDSVQHHCPTCKEIFSAPPQLRTNRFISDVSLLFRGAQRNPQLAKGGDISICPRHQKPLELFCRTDQSCGCMLCPVQDHKSHDIGLLRDQYENFSESKASVFSHFCAKSLKSRTRLKKEQAENDLQPSEDRRKELMEEFEQMIHDRRTKMEEIRRSAAVSRKSAERYISESESTFQVLLQTLRRSQIDLIADLQEKQKDAQRQALPMIRTTVDWAEVSVPPPPYGRKVASTFQDLEERLIKEKEKLVARSKLLRAQEFFRDVSLDPDTANPFLVLSADGKRVHCGGVCQNLADNPRRFQTACNVLGWPGCSSGRFYFQVQVEALASWDVGVARESVPRRGPITTSPQNGFWTIGLRDKTQYKAPGLELRPVEPPKKVGVLVDYEDGRVAFFNVDSAHLLHQFTQCCFSEQLLPFFSPGRRSHCPNPPSLVICPIS